MSSISFILALIALACLVLLVRNVIYPMMIDSYFKGEKFLAVKTRVEQHIAECNELNEHIEHLKLSYNYAEATDYGGGQLSDNSRYNMKRRAWATEINNRSTYQCSASMVKNANNQPYKYLCKYFNISPDEDTLEQFEGVLNDFSAVEQGKYLLANERDAIISSISTSISPYILKNYRDRVTKELGFKKVSLFDLYFPVYTFQYVSAGGNSASKYALEFNLEELERFIGYLADLVKFKNSVAGQRALMTSKLREKIKVRDGYTCQICSLSTADEANLLLEIDHIIPLSKGGITSENNLQTLCWKCNRTKGSKVYSAEVVPNLASTSPAKTDSTWLPRTDTSTSPAKTDSTWPPRTDTSTSPAKTDSTWPPRADTSTSSKKIDMTRPPRANTSTSSKKIDMTRPSRANASTTVLQNLTTKQVANLTRPQANALRSAKDYLEYSGYSRKGRIEQLHECDNYVISDATVAVDSLNVDWKEQAVKSAKDYLEYSGYSCKGLIEQLHECDDYTVSEATYGAEQAGACS